MQINATLQTCRNNLGAASKQSPSPEDQAYLNINKPQWLLEDPADKLNQHFNHVNHVLRSGNVIWGHIIQVNRLLFEDGPDNHPGEIVYSLDDPETVDPNELMDVANKLFALKGTEPDDPDLAPIAEYLTDQYIRVFGLPVPKSISPNINCFISTTVFFRKHLPAQRVICPLFPILINNQSPYIATPLPEKFWPGDFKEQWVQYGASEESEPMEQNTTQNVINTFAKRKMRQLILTIPLILVIIGMVSVEDMEGEIAGIPVKLISYTCRALVIAGIIFSFINWRCPACERYLGRSFSPKFCRRCGAQLQ